MEGRGDVELEMERHREREQAREGEREREEGEGDGAAHREARGKTRKIAGCVLGCDIHGHGVRRASRRLVRLRRARREDTCSRRPGITAQPRTRRATQEGPRAQAQAEAHITQQTRTYTPARLHTRIPACTNESFVTPRHRPSPYASTCRPQGEAMKPKKGGNSNRPP